MIIYISAGHNDQTKGAVYAGTTEARQAKETRDEVISNLKGKLFLYKDDDNFSLEETIDDINKIMPDLAIDIHFNASTNPTARGVEGFAYSTNLEMGSLGRKIVDKISDYTGMKNRGLKYNDKLRFLKDTKCPAILLECGFLSNSDDARLILDPIQDDLISKAISDTILEVYAPQNAVLKEAEDKECLEKEYVDNLNAEIKESLDNNIKIRDEVIKDTKKILDELQNMKVSVMLMTDRIQEITDTIIKRI